MSQGSQSLLCKKPALVTFFNSQTKFMPYFGSLDIILLCFVYGLLLIEVNFS